jgi:hypothetical protein
MLPLTNTDPEHENPRCQSTAPDCTVEGSTAGALKVGCFSVDPCSKTGKRIYLLQMIILPFIPIAALIAQNFFTMVSVALANRDATAINKQVNVCRSSVNRRQSRYQLTNSVEYLSNWRLLKDSVPWR